MSEEANLRNNLEDGLSLPEGAVNWLCDLYAAFQLFDDVADGDAIERKDLDRVLWATLVGMQANPFYIVNVQVLTPVVATQILKWQASDLIERSGKASAQSYMWRAGYYDIVLFVYHLCHGSQVSMATGDTALRLYGESLEDYLKEFGQCPSQS